MVDVKREENAPAEKPQVTFALFAYRQEKYIRDAIAGAFSQTYSSLEIILSDDCSPDRTFEIMTEMAASYTGPHKVILNRMQCNVGLAGHINHVMGLVSGELVVVAAGDDISLPERVAQNVAFYLAEEKPDSIFSDYFDIDENGRFFDQRAESPPEEQTLEEFILNPRIKGAAHAWTRRLFDDFGPLMETVLCEDQAIPFRAHLKNSPRYLPLQLVKYRRVNRVITKKHFFITHYMRMRGSAASYLSDLRLHRASLPNLFPSLEKRLAGSETHLLFWQSELPQAFKMIPRLVKHTGWWGALISLVQKVRSL